MEILCNRISLDFRVLIAETTSELSNLWEMEVDYTSVGLMHIIQKIGLYT